MSALWGREIDSIYFGVATVFFFIPGLPKSACTPYSVISL
jgi:hypothetical protein